MPHFTVKLFSTRDSSFIVSRKIHFTAQSVIVVMKYISSHPEVFLGKRCSEQIYSRTPMPKCDFNNVALQRYWNYTLAWVFSCKLAAYFKNTSGRLLLEIVKQRPFKMFWDELLRRQSIFIAMTILIANIIKVFSK